MRLLLKFIDITKKESLALSQPQPAIDSVGACASACRNLEIFFGTLKKKLARNELNGHCFALDGYVNVTDSPKCDAKKINTHTHTYRSRSRTKSRNLRFTTLYVFIHFGINVDVFEAGIFGNISYVVSINVYTSIDLPSH